MVKEAQFSKPLIQNSIDNLTALFVPGIIFIAFLTFLSRFFFLEEDLIYAISVGISVLVIACPCALGLATPLVLYKSSILANSNGIIFKGYDILERLNQINALVFDKTGTLTTGIFKIKNISQSPNLSRDQVLSYTASLEQYSNHPIARSILLEAEELGVPIHQAKDILETPGKGIEGSVSNKKIEIIKYINLESIETTLQISIGEEKFLIELEEELNTESYVVEDLSSKFKLSILSGDNDIKTGEFAKLLEIDDAIGDLSPEGKLKKIIDLQKSFKIAYVGDGVNDAPSLKQADVGIATSSSTEFARSAGDIILLSGDLNKINTIFTISKNSFKRIKQNLFFALIYNISMIPMATLGKIEPKYAAIAMALSSISVVLNSIREIKI
jgi:Cu+-exporting ATPase